MSDLETEKVTENYQPEPGQMDTRTFWIAYPAHVAGDGHMSDRIARATGRGKTRKAALEDAQRAGEVRRSSPAGRDRTASGTRWSLQAAGVRAATAKRPARHPQYSA